MTALSEANVKRMMEAASTDGSSWADAVRERLRTEGRRVTGMWPGTFSEARVRAGRLLASELGQPAPREVREQVARELYAAARQDWREHNEPE